MRRSQTARQIAARSLALALLATGVGLGGCATDFSPRSNGFSNDRFTYESTTMSPKSVALVDIRTEQTIWSIDVPVGQKLTMQFDSVIDGENPVYPDVMKWVVQPIRLNSWRGSQEILVPGPEARLIELSLRPTPEYPGDFAAMPEEPAFEPVDIEPDADDMDAEMDAEPMENEPIDPNGLPVDEPAEDENG
jgi:hypothetical protein